MPYLAVAAARSSKAESSTNEFGGRQTPKVTLTGTLQNCTSSATLQLAIKPGHVSVVADHSPIQFNPRVGLEREHLCSNDQFRRKPVPTENDGGHSGALEAQKRFKVNEASDFDRTAYLLF
jgi:hypothetical protein